MTTPTTKSLRARFGLAFLAIGLVLAWSSANGRDLDAESLSVRERWSRLTPEEREKVRDRYEAYQGMSESEQRELSERARNVRDMRQRLLRRLTPEQQQRLEALDPPTRNALVGEMLEDELRLQGRRLHAMIPEEWRERIEHATPEERREFFVEFKERHRPRLSLVAIDRLGRLLEKPEQDIVRWKREPESERLVRIVAMHRELAAKSIEASGLPAGVTAQGWSAIQELPPEEFFDEVLRIRSELIRQQLPAETPPLASYPERRRAAAVEILAASRAAPSERLELSDLPPAERRAKLAAARRERLQLVLEKHQALPPELLAEFRALPDDEFAANVRRLVRESSVLRQRRLDARAVDAEGDVEAQPEGASVDDDADRR